MRKLFAHARFCVSAIPVMLLLSCRGIADSQNVEFKPVSRELIETRLRQYAGGDKKREESLKKMFAQEDCGEQHLSEQRVKSAKLPNVICVLPGSSDKVIIVGAHFDHIPAGQGVVDNWSGASLLPSLYAATKGVPRKHTYIFIAFTDEEQGEVGSRFYVQQMTQEQVSATDAMVNLDTLGLAPPEVWASHSDTRLTSAIVLIAKQMNIPISGVNVEQIGSSDGEPFAERRIPRITIHSLTQETYNLHILHTSKDQFSAIRLDDYYETYRLLGAYLAFLDVALNTAPASVQK